jgi:glycosyltransferase involved in cell wall biosynthesis
MSWSQLNILHIAQYYYANPDFARLGKELAKKGHRLSVMTSVRPFDQRGQVDNMEVFEVNPLVTLYRLPQTISFVPTFVYKIVKQQGIEVMHLLNDLSTNAAFASLASRLSAVPYVYTIQGPGTRLGHPLVDPIIEMYHQTVERWIVKRAKRVILLSKSLISAAEELKVSENKMAVIPSGIDPLHFNSERPEVKEKAQSLRAELNLEDSIVLGYVGRLAPVKGLEILFSATKRIQDEYPKLILLIVGDGAIRNELETIANRLKLRTIFAGWKKDALPYYALMDIFVLPSFSEGLANVLLEAMAMKKAVVATRVGGNPDVITNGENGFLVPAGDSESMASAMRQLIEDNGLRGRIGAQNRQKIEQHFSWNATVERIERVYNEAVCLC